MHLRTLAPLVVVAALSGCSDSEQSAVSVVEGALVVVPAGASAEGSEALTAEAVQYLERVAGAPPRVETAADWGQARALAASSKAPVVLVLGASALLPERYDEPRMQALGESGFVLDAFEEGTWRAGDGEFGAAFVLTDGNTVLSRQYAVYEALRRLGVRFFHPEQEHVPTHAVEDLRPLALRPTALHREGLDYLPDYAWRSWSFHSSHPLEHLESFSDGDAPIDEAQHVNAWIVKNRGNRGRGAGRGIASEASRERRVQELDALRHELGFPRGTGITLHNEQQGASAEIDPSRPEPVRAQIEALVTRKLEDAPDARWFGIHFGPTEFTTTPDLETVQWIDWAGAKVLELRPDIDVLINVHITGSQPTPNFSDLGCDAGTNADGLGDYYDLAFHTDPRLGVSVHTVMFYPLEGPARVYNQQTFAHKLCLMQRASAQGRPMQWFPEGSWWLSFDNSVPVYLPLYLWARQRDVELTAPFLEERGRGSLRAHRMFNSGHEWGYWQQDYAVGLWAWNVDVPMTAVLEELFDPLCAPADWAGCAARDEAVIVLEEVMEHQRELFLERTDWQGRPGGLYTYFAGEDQGDEIAAASGFEFRPVRVPFTTVVGWDEEQLQVFESSDLEALDDAARLDHGWADRLEALSGQVHPSGEPWLREVVDGIRINALRAEHTEALFRAVVAHRRAALTGNPSHEDDATQWWAQAEQALADAEAVIRAREAAYRYPAEQVYGGGLTPDTAVPNGTTYGYRVHTKTHLLTYWTRRHEQVGALLSGEDVGATQSVRLQDAIAAPGVALDLAWPAIEGLAGSISVGDLQVGPPDLTLDLGGGEGIWSVDGELTTGGAPLHVAGLVARASVRGETPVGGLDLSEPSAPLAQTALAFVLPRLRWAWLAEPPTVVWGYDLDENGSILHEHVQRAAVADGDASGFTTEPFLLSIPVERSGGSVLDIRVQQAVLQGSVVDGALAPGLQLSGEIRVDDLVTVLIEIGGFDEAGALSTLSEILAFDAAEPPATVPFQGQFEIEPVGQ